MRKTSQHLNDEHMQLYEWSGAGSGIVLDLPARSKRTHPWHASYAVLAVMTSVLILNGCDNKAPATRASAKADQGAGGAKRKAGPLYDELGAQPAAPEANGAPAPAVEKSGAPSGAVQNPDQTLPA
jgi:hypothetical protein